MSRRRSRLEIILNLLSTIRDGTDKPTRIMYAINLSWSPTKKMLSDLMDQELIEMNTASGNSKKRYTITQKGIRVLDYFEKAKEILPTSSYLTLSTPS